MDVAKFITENKKKIIIGSSVGYLVLLGGAIIYRYSNYSDLMLQASEYPQIIEEYGDVGLLVKNLH